jgi:hypothetical protein
MPVSQLLRRQRLGELRFRASPGKKVSENPPIPTFKKAEHGGSLL